MWIEKQRCRKRSVHECRNFTCNWFCPKYFYWIQRLCENGYSNLEPLRIYILPQTSKAQVTEMILIFTLIHVSVIYPKLWIHWIYWISLSFTENSNIAGRIGSNSRQKHMRKNKQYHPDLIQHKAERTILVLIWQVYRSNPLWLNIHEHPNLWILIVLFRRLIQGYEPTYLCKREILNNNW